MEPEPRDKVNEERIEYMKNRTDAEAPRYIARLKPYADLARKRSRAYAARKNLAKRRAEAKRKAEIHNKDNPNEIQGQHPDEETGLERRRSGSRTLSIDVEDACCRKRRRRRRSSCCRRRRRRRRSCGRRRRRRRSCRRRSRCRRRRRRRSCSRRRRRRSCKRRRRRRRRC